MLTTVNFDDEAFFEANKVENKALEGSLSSKFEPPEPSVAKQPPHRQFRIGGLVADLLCEAADAFGDRSMAWCLQREPLTRRRTSFGATLSHKGRGEIRVRVTRSRHTRIGIST